MGNYVSCTLSAPKNKHSSKRTIKVIFPSGEIRQLDDQQQPIKAAELMFDTPNFFLVNSASLQIGRRFSALNADEDLEMANVYVMFPMKRLNSVITTSDMGALFLTANSAAVAAAKSSSHDVAQVMPEPAVDYDWREKDTTVAAAKLDLDDFEEFSSLEIKHRLSMSRSKKPLLETIAEEPICSR